METDTDKFNLDEGKMIILITGASHTGKTLLAQKMLEKYKYPYLSIDHLKMGLIRSGNTELTPEDDEVLTGYLWPIIREIVKTAIENKQNLIIEKIMNALSNFIQSALASKSLEKRMTRQSHGFG